MADFLLEIGCEEIPARMIDAAREELVRRVADVLTSERLATTAEIESFSTPRRISVLARGVAVSQADVEEQQTGPAVKVAFKDGQPTPAAHAFAKKVGVAVEQLRRVQTPKGEYLAAHVVKRGRRTGDILSEALPGELKGIYWPKNMYWRPGRTSERFVRPVRWMVAALDGDTLPVEFGGIVAGRETRGHRILSSGPVEIGRPASYPEALKSVAVIASPAERLLRIRKALDAATRTIPGARWREDAELLDTVVNLTEFPSVVLGSFDNEFLSLPDEVLVTVMRDHQKYFAVEDSAGKLLPHFLAVLNTDGDPEGLIRHGNERVLRARFNDARFFWNTDQKISLRQRVELLKSVTFQKDLGSYYDKTLRVQKLASWIAEVLRDSGMRTRPGVIHKAACLAKADLTTELVKEFTELQGIVGGLYARVQQLDSEMTESGRGAIATAIYDHYKPESTEDAVPRTLEGAVLSMADKADSIAGMFALGLIPSGSKDPFALRRQANGIIKILAGYRLSVPFTDLFATAMGAYEGLQAARMFKPPLDLQLFRQQLRSRLTAESPPTAGNGASSQKKEDGLAAVTAEFLRERLQFYLRDVRGFAYDVVNAVLAAGADDVVDALARTEALAQVRPLEDFEHISIAFKRIKNILRQATDKGIEPKTPFDREQLKEAAERALAKGMSPVASRVQELKAQRDFVAALSEIARLRPPLDTFFDKVMVMVDDTELRANRLGLLQAVFDEFTTIADFSEIVTERK